VAWPPWLAPHGLAPYGFAPFGLPAYGLDPYGLDPYEPLWFGPHFEFPWMGPLMDSYGLDSYGSQPLGFSFAICIVGVLTLSAVHGALCLRPCVGNLERMAHAQQRPI